MTNLDHWLAEATAATGGMADAASIDAIEARLRGEPSPASLAARRDSQRMMLCAGLAALLGFTATGVSGAFAKSNPTWIAAPSASSPYSLLVGR